MRLQHAGQRLAAAGRRGDTTLGHLTPGEQIVPLPVLRAPGVESGLDAAFRRVGLDRGRYRVGGWDDRRNPRTGLREYAVGDPDADGPSGTGGAGVGGGEPDASGADHESDPAHGAATARGQADAEAARDDAPSPGSGGGIGQAVTAALDAAATRIGQAVRDKAASPISPMAAALADVVGRVNEAMVEEGWSPLPGNETFAEQAAAREASDMERGNPERGVGPHEQDRPPGGRDEAEEADEEAVAAGTEAEQDAVAGVLAPWQGLGRLPWEGVPLAEPEPQAGLVGQARLGVRTSAATARRLVHDARVGRVGTAEQRLRAALTPIVGAVGR